MLLRRHARDVAAVCATQGARSIARRAGLRQWREARAARRGDAARTSRRRRAPDRHLVAGARRRPTARGSRFGQIIVSAIRAPTKQGLRVGAPVRPAPIRARWCCFLGSNIGNFDPPAADALLGAIREPLAPRRAAPARRRSRQAARRTCCSPTTIRSASPRRSTGTCSSASTASSAPTSISRRSRTVRSGTPREQRVEMHLVSRATSRSTWRPPDVRVPFAAGESIWTESSYKYAPESLRDLGTDRGFTVTRSVDRRGRAICADAVRKPI